MSDDLTRSDLTRELHYMQTQVERGHNSEAMNKPRQTVCAVCGKSVQFCERQPGRMTHGWMHVRPADHLARVDEAER
jgi:hypothetical protein